MITAIVHPIRKGIEFNRNPYIIYIKLPHKANNRKCIIFFIVIDNKLNINPKYPIIFIIYILITLMLMPIYPPFLYMMFCIVLC